MPCKYYGNCKHQNESCKSYYALIKCVYGLNEYCTEQTWELDALREENKELKRLLRLAVEDIKKVSDDNCCYHCIYGNPITRHCEEYRGDENCYKWQHAEEAMKLLGDEDNEQ